MDDPAWEDLAAAAEYIARDSESYAAAFVQEMQDAATSLSEMAERGQIVPESRDPSIRELLVRPYRLVYRLNARKSQSSRSSMELEERGELSAGPPITSRSTGPPARIRSPPPVNVSVRRRWAIDAVVGVWETIDVNPGRYLRRIP